MAQRSTPNLEDEGGLGAVLCRVSHSRPIWYDWAYQKHVAAGIALLISETLQAPAQALPPQQGDMPKVEPHPSYEI